jgi:hypothetical protein
MNELNEEEIQILMEALDDEYLAYATYDQVIKDFGPIRPFISICVAEGRHINALLGLFERYGLSIPDNPWPGRVDRYASAEAACKAGVEAEIANGEMYDRLIQNARKPDIVAVLKNLQAASQLRHLPAFQRCEERGAGGLPQQHDGSCGGGRGRRHQGRK